MIYVNLKGGLGNQMFQYACARALSLRAHMPLALTRSEYAGDTKRTFSLAHFAIGGSMIPPIAIPRLQKLRAFFEQKVLRKFYVAFDASILTRKGAVYLDGYFQSEKYFADYAERIREDFALVTELSSDARVVAKALQRDSSAVALHVRRGDYVHNAEFGNIADAAYYARALTEMRKRVPQPHIYVFSDDIPWCRKNLPLSGGTIFVSKPDMHDYEELTLMSMCKHNIIANSSFSWWGAWLNQNPEKVVIAPATWSNLHGDTWYRDIIPDSWIRV